MKNIFNICFRILVSASLLAPLSSSAQTQICSQIHSDGKFVAGSTELLTFSQMDAFLRFSSKAEAEKYKAWSEKAVIHATRKTIHKKVIEACSGGRCSETDVARLVQSSIAESFQKFDEFKLKMKKIKGYAILTGLSVGVAFSSHYLKAALPANDSWMSDFVTIASSILLYKLGAPLWDYVGGVAIRGAFRMKDGKSFLRQGSEYTRYEAQYKLLQEKMTPREQIETARVSSLLNSLEPRFSSILESLQSKDPSKGGIEKAAAYLALTAIKMRQYFPEITADDPDVNGSVRLAFTQFLGEDGTRERLSQLAIQQIESYYLVNNENLGKTNELVQICKETVIRWVGLP